MRKTMTLAAVAVATTALTGGSALAACAGSQTYGQTFSSDPGDYSYIITPGAGVLGDTLTGFWWAIGSGDREVGLGNDAGSLTAADWLTDQYSGGLFMAESSPGALDWINPSVDGCIADAGFPPMALVVADRSADGSTAYMMVACVDSTHNSQGLTYDFAFAEGTGGGNDLTLVEIPMPAITGIGGRDVQVTFPSLAEAFFADTSCDPGSFVQVCAYYTEADGAAGPATGMSVGTDPTSSWVQVPGGCAAANSDAAVTFTSPDATVPGNDIFIASGVVVDDNSGAFEVPMVGPANPTPIAGDPLIADEIVDLAARWTAPKRFTVRWTTTSEVNVIGFNVERSRGPGGPYLVVNETLMPALGVGGAGSDYDFLDNLGQGPVARAYYYRVEVLYSDGTSEFSAPTRGRSRAFGPMQGEVQLGQ